MITMKSEYAQKLLEGGYSFGHRQISCHDNMLVIDDDGDYYQTNYYGTELVDGKLQVDAEDFVKFQRVNPVIDETTRWSF